MVASLSSLHALTDPVVKTVEARKPGHAQHRGTAGPISLQPTGRLDRQSDDAVVTVTQRGKQMHSIIRSAAVAVTLVAGLSACGQRSDQDQVSEAAQVPHPYDGPMQVKLDRTDRASVERRSGAAGRALECDNPPYAGGGADYGDGLESVQGTATDAFGDWLRAEGVGLPDRDYHLERQDDGRALLSFDVAQRTKVAVIVADGVHDFAGHEGWGVESWAQCDPAELPEQYDQALGIEVWEDDSGHRVPVSRVRSFRGPEHCDWQDITFLYVGPDPHADLYLRDTTGELADALRAEYSDQVSVPDDAMSTGYRHDGRELWLQPGRPRAAYLVNVDDPTDVEQWPAATSGGVGCA